MSEREELGRQIEAVRSFFRRLSEGYRAQMIHNAEVHRRSLREDARAHGIDLRDPEWEAKASNARQEEARARRAVREKNRESARQKKGSRHEGTPEYETLRQNVADLMAGGESHNYACERTAREFHTSRSTVYRVTRDLLPTPE